MTVTKVVQTQKLFQPSFTQCPMQAPISSKCAAPYNSSVAVNMDCCSPTGMLNKRYLAPKVRVRNGVKEKGGGGERKRPHSSKTALGKCYSAHQGASLRTSSHYGTEHSMAVWSSLTGPLASCCSWQPPPEAQPWPWPARWPAWIGAAPSRPPLGGSRGTCAPGRR